MPNVINFEDAKKRLSCKVSPRPKIKKEEEIKKEVLAITLEINERVVRLLKLMHRK